MQINLNGQPYHHQKSVSELPLLLLLKDLGVSPEATAVALNNEVVPHSLWSETRIKEKDSIEIIRAVGGG